MINYAINFHDIKKTIRLLKVAIIPSSDSVVEDKTPCFVIQNFFILWILIIGKEWEM